MTATAATLPGTGANDASIGTIAWTGASDALTSNNVRALATFAGGSTSQYLKLTNFGFAIPNDARIDGVEITLEAHASAGTMRLISLALVTAGVIGTVKSLSYTMALTTDETTKWGSPTEQWRVALTPAIVNASNFGFVLRVQNVSGASEARVDAAWLTIYYTRNQDKQVTTVKLRSGRPPHGAQFSVIPEAVRYAFKVRGTGSATFLLSKAHAQIGDIWDFIEGELSSGVRPMITIEQPDGFLPWVGFLTELDAPNGDPQIALQAADHFSLLADAVTKQSGTESGASGYLIRDMVQDMNARGYPPIFLGVEGILAGPPASYTFKMATGEQCIRDMEKQTGWEAYFTYALADDYVITTLAWSQQQGQDLRNEDVWQDGKQFSRRDYSLKVKLGYDNAIAVGGGGSFGARTSVAVNRKGGKVAGVGSAFAASNLGALGGKGTVLAIDPQTTDKQVLRQLAQSALDAPENAAEQIPFVVVEKQIDRERLSLGDIRKVRFREFGKNFERDVRIIGLQFIPGAGAIDMTTVVVND